MDKVWSQLPNDLIERIARFADIDTRRAMGFGPRKLNVTFDVPQWTRKWTEGWGVIFTKGDSFVARELEFGDVYRCGARACYGFQAL